MSRTVVATIGVGMVAGTLELLYPPWDLFFPPGSARATPAPALGTVAMFLVTGAFTGAFAKLLRSGGSKRPADLLVLLPMVAIALGFVVLAGVLVFVWVGAP